MTENIRVLLLGAGPMAQAYGHVLKAESVPTVVVGRGAVSAEAFEGKVGLPVLTDGLQENLEALDGVTHAIVALPVPNLASATTTLLKAGIKDILVEKPAGLVAQEIEDVAKIAKTEGARVYVAYNRRFYASVQEARRRIREDGGVTSFRFEFSEWSARIAPSAQPESVKAAWFLANSTHVVDMAFFLGGFPEYLESLSAGDAGWHAPDVFVGHGRTTEGALFSYHADWGAAPRWMVEVCTPGKTYMFQPLEGLKVRTEEGFAIEEIVCEGADDDVRFKPGIRRQTLAFLQTPTSPDLVTIGKQSRHAAIYTKMSKSS